MNDALKQLLKMGAHQMGDLSINRVDAVANPAHGLPFLMLKSGKPTEGADSDLLQKANQAISTANSTISTIQEGVRGVLKSIATNGDSDYLSEDTAEALTLLAGSVGLALTFKSSTPPAKETKTEEESETAAPTKEEKSSKKTTTKGTDTPDVDSFAEAATSKIMENFAPVFKALKIKVKEIDDADTDDDDDTEEEEVDPSPRVRKHKQASSSQVLADKGSKKNLGWAKTIL